ncbi:DUF1223 domain-containing protein [Pontiella sp.]|uniref:DUF1223 domain-containing protein n=1 Tax=Pontiella sp. TaxID=2837462 RepID=UPI003569BFAC
MNRLLCSTLLCTALAASAQERIFESPARQVSLIELYTSEGCSSCPPAEEKLNTYADHKGLWSEFVPVAFHVDYWNYIGWDDRFSKPEFSTRQRQYSKHWKARTIYTPCFVINGTATRHPVPKAGKQKPGTLRAVLNGNRLAVTFNPEQNHTALTAWAAPLSGKVTTAVKAGENRGRTLEHCFVALDLDQIPMTEARGVWTAEIKLNTALPASALAIWISDGRNLRPIQAAGGWLE